MAFTAGQTLTAAQLNNITTKYLEARSSANNALGGAQADVAGATLTFTTPVANTVVKVASSWDIAGTSGTMIGVLFVDGAADTTGEAHFQGNGRASVFQGWTVTLGSAGSHTLKLRVSGDATQTLFSAHTKIQVEGPGLT